MCRAGGTAIIRRVPTTQAAKGAGSPALAAGRLAVFMWASHLEAGQLVRPYRQGGVCWRHTICQFLFISLPAMPARAAVGEVSL